MTQYSLGDRVLVRLVGSRAERPADVIDDRGDRVRVQYDAADGDFREKEVVTKSRVRPIPPPRVAPIIPPPGIEVEVGPALPRATQSFRDGVASLVAAGGPTEFVLRAVPKPPKRYENADYLKYVRETHACCCCGERPSVRNPMVAHHHGPRGMSAKCDDTRTVPLLDKCHRHFHDHGVFRGTLAIGEWTREQTDECARYTQAALLVRYCKQQGIDTDNVIIEALTAALREED